ncbi:TonB-dependent receptor domain-containing protein [Croceicoccus sp. BE223]|uniref:TonB-dependent receptor n=1 Tax=Croceicoccus sp. BE223 TaxID=2817716 RepID=UPI00285D6B7F|nr:TonB-dependent receptor [Croceicoccus sp. BE223]MDR7101628.1 outer membrane receptor protein involved in Fe transport [Croceicoccus sp. BE223]
MRPLAILLTATTLALAAPAAASERAVVTGAGTAGSVAIALARQTGSSIVIADPVLARRSVPAIRGRMDAAGAVRRLARALGGKAVATGANAWRIVAAPAPVARPAVRRETAGPRSAAPVEVPSGAPIVVQATKRDLRLDQIPAQVSVLDGEALAIGGAGGTEEITRRLATVSSTYLGSGRNKLFIRGIADSSFTGPTQATVGQYFGDLRLSYNTPDPDLRLSDMERVEVLEGPQGTLYGAGALGGIIRLVPNRPSLSDATVAGQIGGALTSHGSPSGDASVTVNLPAGDAIAIRGTFDAAVQGGYIDKPRLNRDDVNLTRILGGRLAARADISGDWSVEVTGLGQSIDARDAQYADRGDPPLTSTAPMTEGADIDYALAALVVTGRIGAVRLRSTTGIVWQDLEERYDAAMDYDPERLFVQSSRSRMIANETRAWVPETDGFGWLVGASLTRSEAELRRRFVASDKADIAGDNALAAMGGPSPGVTNTVDEATLYGEASLRILPGVVATAGGRLTWARLGGGGEDVAMDIAAARSDVTEHRTAIDVLPSVALHSELSDRTVLYVRYQEGFRPGGLAIESEFVRRFRSDRTATYEIGARHGSAASDPLHLAVSLSHTDWRNIQADFIDGSGLPSTANIGDGRIWSASLSGSARLAEGLRLEAGATWNRSKIDEPVMALRARTRQVPNIAEFAGRVALSYAGDVGSAMRLNADAWLGYIGPSRLGIGPELGNRQGDYLDTGIEVRLGSDAMGLSLTVDNIADVRGNRFSLGTPFSESRDQVTPLRPRTIRIGLDRRF